MLLAHCLPILPARETHPSGSCRLREYCSRPRPSLGIWGLWSPHLHGVFRGPCVVPIPVCSQHLRAAVHGAWAWRGAWGQPGGRSHLQGPAVSWDGTWSKAQGRAIALGAGLRVLAKAKQVGRFAAQMGPCGMGGGSGQHNTRPLGPRMDRPGKGGAITAGTWGAAGVGTKGEAVGGKRLHQPKDLEPCGCAQGGVAARKPPGTGSLTPCPCSDPAAPACPPCLEEQSNVPVACRAMPCCAQGQGCLGRTTQRGDKSGRQGWAGSEPCREAQSCRDRGSDAGGAAPGRGALVSPEPCAAGWLWPSSP